MNESEPTKPANPFDSAQGKQRPTRFRNDASKESFLRRMRRQRLKYITILPSLVTIINGVCGFAAITFASQAITSETGLFSYHKFVVSYFAMAGYMILLAMVADMLDGRLARMSQSTSSFGGQLDSLCDVISFGVAPAFLMLKIIERNFDGLTDFNAVVINFLERFIWLMGAVYMSCAAIRLARFNVENEEDESAHMSFVGLPTPAAAGVIASLVIFHQQTVPDIAEHSMLAGMILGKAIVYSMPALALLLAVLMVSRVRYAHIVNQYIRGKKPFAHLIWVLLFLGLIIWCWQLAFVVIFCGFAASGFMKWLYYRFFHRDRHALDESAVSTLH